jgi:phage head maturation protease
MTPKLRIPATYATRAALEVRSDDLPAGVCGRVTGAALAYGVVDSYGTRFAAGCLERTKREKLAAGKVALYLDHTYGVRAHVGVVRTLTTSGNTEQMVADLFDTEDGRRAKEYLGAVLAAGGQTGLSVGFFDRGSAPVTDAGQTVVEFREVELEEVSIPPRPAVPGANVSGVRSESDRDAATHLHTIALRALFERAGPERFAALVRSVAGDEPAAPKFGKGARVEALADHMEGMKGSTGKVTLVRNGPYYGVTFDGERKIHKWLAEDEITAASVDEDESGGSMAGMAHGKTRALPDGGLAPDDPQRVALEETLRAVTLRSLGTAA